MDILDINNLNRQDIKGALIGMLLGDACIDYGKYLKIEHIDKVFDYVQWKAQIINNNLCYASCYLYTYKNGKKTTQKNYRVAKSCSKAHPLISKISERFYYQGRRTIDSHLIKCLNPIGLAIWYMDDGCLKYKCKNKQLRETSLKSWEVVLATHAFNRAEHDVLVNILYKQFGLIFRVQKQNNFFYLALSAKSQDLFWLMVAPYIVQVESMCYKLPPVVLRQYRAEPIREGVETMHQPPFEHKHKGEDIVRPVWKHTESGRNDQIIDCINLE